MENFCIGLKTTNNTVHIGGMKFCKPYGTLIYYNFFVLQLSPLQISLYPHFIFKIILK